MSQRSLSLELSVTSMNDTRFLDSNFGTACLVAALLDTTDCEHRAMVSQNAGTWDDKVVQVLPLVLANCPVVSQFKTIGNLLQVNTSVRWAVQQSTGNMIITGPFAGTLGGMCRWMCFAEWLPCHPGLVSSMEICLPTNPDAEQLAQKILAMSLRLCASKGSARDVVVAAASEQAGASAQDQHSLAAPIQPRLQLQCCTLGHCQPALLMELAGAGLQELKLVSLDTPVTPAVCAALGQLKSLQTLSIGVKDRRLPLDAALTTAIGQLSRLTRLVCGTLTIDSCVYLPQSLQSLESRFAAGNNGSLTLDLSHLTALSHLQLIRGSDGRAAVQAVLPPELVSLVAMDPVLSVSGLRDLQDLQTVVQDCDRAGLTTLGALLQLPRLSDLDLYLCAGGQPSSPHALQQAVATIGSASNLTHVRFSNFGSVASGIHWCRELSRLPKLRELHLMYFDAQRLDLLHLTNLSTLHSLKIDRTNSLHDVAAVALADSLTALRELYLNSASISSLALLPVLGALRHLHYLHVKGGAQFVVTDAELQLLTGLKKLTYLSFGNHQCSSDGIEEYVAGIPGLSCVYD